MGRHAAVGSAAEYGAAVLARREGEGARDGLARAFGLGVGRMGLCIEENRGRVRER